MTGWKTGLLLAGAIGIGSASMWAFLNWGDGKASDAGATYRTSVKKGESRAQGKTPFAKKISGRRVAFASPVRKGPPKFEIGADEEAKLTAAQAQLLAEIRAALAAEKTKEIIRLVRRIQAMEEWPDGIPMAVKRASLEALGWCGAAALPELLGFLGDADSSVVSTAASYWEDAIAECEHDVDKKLADGTLEEGLSTHVKNAAKIINDAEVMDSVLSEINSGMRHSVAVETIKEILASGNDVAKGKVQSVIEDLTDDASIKTAEQLDEWLKKNPDDADDKYMYGGEEDTVADED